MKLGVIFPQTEIGANPDDVARFAQAVEEIGYSHLVCYEHVLGANTASRPNWTGPYTSESLFHEPFVMYGFLAGLTKTIEFVTAILILPQRQTALVAKQAASLDVICKGRFRLGIGTGWNDVEYEALGENFHDRGKRSEEQIDLMRKLWAEPTIDYDGRWHKITDAGLNPLPTNKSIPIWFGGMAPQVLERVGRIGDGWFPFYNPGLKRQIEQIHQSARAVGRSISDIGIEVFQPLGGSGQNELDQVKSLIDLGATHSSVITMNAGLNTPDAHIDAIKRYWDNVASKVN